MSSEISNRRYRNYRRKLRRLAQIFWAADNVNVQYRARNVEPRSGKRDDRWIGNPYQLFSVFVDRVRVKVYNYGAMADIAGDKRCNGEVQLRETFFRSFRREIWVRRERAIKT